MKKANVERAIRVLREVEVLQSAGAIISEACRKIGVGEHSYYRWKREFRGDPADRAGRDLLCAADCAVAAPRVFG